MEHHRNARPTCGTWNLDQCTKRCLANHALERKSPNQLATKMAHNTQNDGKNFSGGSRWKHKILHQL